MRLDAIHAQVVDAHLERQAAGAHRRERNRGNATRRQDQLRLVGHVPREGGHRIEAFLRAEELQFVQDQDDRLGHS